MYPIIMSMICPKCNHDKIGTTDTRKIASIVRRRRICMKCNMQFYTQEIFECLASEKNSHSKKIEKTVKLQEGLVPKRGRPVTKPKPPKPKPKPKKLCEKTTKPKIRKKARTGKENIDLNSQVNQLFTQIEEFDTTEEERTEIDNLFGR